MRNEAEAIDLRKIKLEVRGFKELNRLFRQMANDAGNLYRLTGNISSKEFAENYRPDFIKVIKDILRSSVKEFGSDIRDEAKKSFSENLITKQDEEQDRLNQEVIAAGAAVATQFAADMTLYVNNTAETQADFVIETNAKMVEEGITAAQTAVLLSQTRITNEIGDLTNRLFQAESRLTLDPSSQSSWREAELLRRQIDGLRGEIDGIRNNVQQLEGDLLEANLLSKSPERSSLISEQEVGFGESEARETESVLIAAALISAGVQFGQTKGWVAILDDVTRPAHIVADEQIVQANQDFLVGGERLSRPRDPRGSLANIMRCRCVAIYSFKPPPN